MYQVNKYIYLILYVYIYRKDYNFLKFYGGLLHFFEIYL